MGLGIDAFDLFIAGMAIAGIVLFLVSLEEAQ